LPLIAHDPAESKLEIVEFHHSELKEFLLDPTQKRNDLIGDLTVAKVKIFVTLCSILCDRSESKMGSRKTLHRYATLYFRDHLLEIDPKKTDAQQGRDVVDALSRVMTNENNVCSIFESVMDEELDSDFFYLLFPLYDDEEIARPVITWARMMSFHDDEYLKEWADRWVSETIKDPRRIFRNLARGHLENLSKEVTAEKARLPYAMALRALAKEVGFSETVFVSTLLQLTISYRKRIFTSDATSSTGERSIRNQRTCY
jgi:hypothetical protein